MPVSPAGALLAHLLQFTSLCVFGIIKTTDVLNMVYLSGIAAIGGSIIGTTVYTVLASHYCGYSNYCGYSRWRRCQTGCRQWSLIH